MGWIGELPDKERLPLRPVQSGAASNFVAAELLA
jgi:hypothetical protein